MGWLSPITRIVLVWGVLGAPASAADPGATKPEPKPSRIQQLIAQLGHESYAERQRAQEELAKFGFDAYDELTKAKDHPDLEIASRARYLLRLIRVQWTSENDPPHVKKILQDYEIQSPEVRLSKIVRLARIGKGAAVPALCRLVRFEDDRLPILSKYAAMELLRREPTDPAARARHAQMLREHLGDSRQPGAVWLTTYLRLRANPQAVLPEWTKLVEAEQALLLRSPERSHVEFVATLLYQQALVEMDHGDAQAAEQTAHRARQSISTGRAAQIGAHLDTAFALRERGLFRWAELEYREVLNAGMNLYWPRAQIGLSEMWHDQGKHLAAAEARQELLQAVEQGKLRNVNLDVAVGMTPAEVRARMNYFFACHWEEQGDRQKQRKHLDEALQFDPEEIDTLIACYRLPGQPAEYQRKIAELIEKAASALVTDIEDQPDNAANYNQYAWLVGNTVGDYDKALEFARKALELSPDNSAYLDTLARVYFAKGDLENAVKYQTLAHENDPHSGLIAKQLKLFQDALAARKPEAEKGRPAQAEKGKP